MMAPHLLPITPETAGAVLALNNAHAVELSWLDADGLAALLRQAFHATRIGTIDAFLLSLDESAAYDSPNYQWFRQRFDRFVYVDRIVVAEAARGRGYARCLYATLLRCAAEAGHRRIVCEVNTDPPNPASAALHAALGFRPIGTAPIHGGRKIVQYLARDLP